LFGVPAVIAGNADALFSTGRGKWKGVECGEM